VWNYREILTSHIFSKFFHNCPVHWQMSSFENMSGAIVAQEIESAVRAYLLIAWTLRKGFISTHSYHTQLLLPVFLFSKQNTPNDWSFLTWKQLNLFFYFFGHFLDVAIMLWFLLLRALCTRFMPHLLIKNNEGILNDLGADYWN
jgi:hypothetical protein